MRSSCYMTVALVLTLAATAAAQAPQAAPARAPEPALRRWFEFQQFTLGTRYRFIKSNAGVTTSNHMQYREQIRARVNIDSRKRYTINSGFYSGTQFIGSWDNLGPGTGEFDGRDHSMRQLYFAAAPVSGIEAQFGGLYVNRGENTEYTSYDDDGYLVGGRFSVRRPKSVYFDEISVTHGSLASTNVPNLWKRWDDLQDTNYTQLLTAKRLTQVLSASVDYTHLATTDTVRGGLALRFKAGAPVSSVRYEQYIRTSAPRAAGFALMAERPFTGWLRVQGGYVTVDERYGGLNADRIQRGRRVFALANVSIYGPLSASLFVTRAFNATYSLSNRTRVDGVVAWDVLNSLRKTGVF
jgi:hypothetical protein